MDDHEIKQILEGCEFFKGLEEPYIESVAGLCQVRNYEPGEYVFSQGDFGEYLYVIAEGNVTLERSMDLGSRKGNAVIGLLGKGRVMGCWSTLLGQPHNLMSSAVCQKPTTVLRIKGRNLRAIMTENHDLGFSVMESLCFLLRDRLHGALGAMEKI
ncbi:MAG: cyclic nucleotide-binding domain-containing protein [Deltaproteobacteria bacterium]|nr:cyclic nucleotide-binding domain-containing protein [Deltaproteobacteria bacterium]